MAVTSAADRLAAGFLRERLTAQLAWHQLDEPLRLLRAPLGLVSSLRDSADLLPRDDDDDWRRVAQRLAAIPAMFDGWRASLELGLARGLPAARRQAVEEAAAAERCAGSHDALVAPTATGRSPTSSPRPPRRPIRDTPRSPATCGRTTRRGPPAADGVGAERYAVAARLSLGADIDLAEAYEWGWAELQPDRGRDEGRGQQRQGRAPAWPRRPRS